MKEREDESRLLDALRWLPAGTEACMVHQRADEPVARIGTGHNAPFGCRSCIHVMRIDTETALIFGEVSAAHLPDWSATSV